MVYFHHWWSQVTFGRGCYPKGSVLVSGNSGHPPYYFTKKSSRLVGEIFFSIPTRLVGSPRCIDSIQLQTADKKQVPPFGQSVVCAVRWPSTTVDAGFPRDFSAISLLTSWHWSQSLIEVSKQKTLVGLHRGWILLLSYMGIYVISH